MIAAIYARKSTEQPGVADEQKSVARQVDNARAYAHRKGWIVDQAHVYIDDGISGAEFAARPAFLRLMNTLKPRPPFTVLVMSEESRLGREAIETAYALKQLVTAGVRVFFYLEDRERTLDSPTDKIMLSLTAFADELEREKARQRTYDAMVRKARAGHVTGGITFGYDNVPICSADGRRSHVERRIKDREAAVVRQIFQLCAEGVGQTRIAKTLNAEHAPAPRAQQGRPTSWAPTSVHEVLYRELYRGVIVWNRSRKRNQWGEQAQTARPTHEWLRLDAPALRIVTDADWDAAHRRLAEARAQYERTTHGARQPRRDRESKYLLPGFARCALCGGGLHIRSRSHGRRRAFFYACTSHYNRGPEICSHVEQWPMEEIDREVIEEINEAVFGRKNTLGPADELVTAAREMFDASFQPARHDALRRELAGIEQEVRNLTDMAAAGAKDIPALVDRLQCAEGRRRELVAALAQARLGTSRTSWCEIERRLRKQITDWHSLLNGPVARARDGLRQLLTRPVLFTPSIERGYRAIRFEGQLGLRALLFGGEVVTNVASPTGTGLSYQPVFRGIWCSDRRAA